MKCSIIALLVCKEIQVLVVSLPRLFDYFLFNEQSMLHFLLSFHRIEEQGFNFFKKSFYKYFQNWFSIF